MTICIDTTLFDMMMGAVVLHTVATYALSWMWVRGMNERDDLRKHDDDYPGQFDNI